MNVIQWYHLTMTTELLYDIPKLLKAEIEVAKELLAKAEPGCDAGFDTYFLLYNPIIAERPTKITVRLRNDEEKQRKFYAMSMTARMAQVTAIMLVSDARETKRNKVDEFLKLKPCQGVQDLNRYSRDYAQAMRKYDGYLGNLPHDCYEDSIVAAIKGPKVKPQVMIVTYKKIEGRLVFDEPVGPTHDGGHCEMRSLPDWWERVN
jgi:hypothetical protein